MRCDFCCPAEASLEPSPPAPYCIAVFYCIACPQYNQDLGYVQGMSDLAAPIL